MIISFHHRLQTNSREINFQGKFPNSKTERTFNEEEKNHKDFRIKTNSQQKLLIFLSAR